VDKSAVYSRPEDRSAILADTFRGDNLTISNTAKNGWYRALVPGTEGSPKYGWVRANDLAIGRAGGISAGSKSRKSNRNHWVVNVGAMAHYIQPADFQLLPGESANYFVAPTYELSMGYRLSTRWTLGLWGQYFNFMNVTDTATGGDFMSNAFSGGLLINFSMVHSLPWKFDLAVIAGGSWVEVSHASSVGTLTSSRTFSPSGIGKLTLRRYFGSTFSMGLVGGYRYLAMYGLKLSRDETVDVLFSSGFGGLDLQFEF
jgi:hypothetical protein